MMKCILLIKSLYIRVLHPFILLYELLLINFYINVIIDYENKLITFSMFTAIIFLQLILYSQLHPLNLIFL